MGTTGQSVTLANSIIGVGILAMPFCFQQCGVLLATLILFTMGLVSRLCCHFLLKSAIITRRRNFEFLAFHVFGSAGKFATEVGIIGFLMGTCIAYFVVVGDLGPQIIAKMFNINQSDILRTSIMVIVSLVCVLPLGLLRNVDSLSNVSAATIAFYFCLVIKVIVEATSQLLTADWHTRIEMWKPSGMLQCVPIFSMALFCQTQLFEIFESLPSLSLEKMNVVTKNAINICTAVYFTLGVFGYIAFGSQEISGNILMSLSPTMASDVIKLGFVMSLAFSFPLIIFPCRASLYSFLYRKAHPPHHEHIINHSIPEGTFRLMTVCIVGAALTVGLLIPNIELVLGLVGSTIGVLVCLVFPAACFVNVTFKNTNERVLAKGIVVLGLVILVLGTYANLEAAESSRERYDDRYITQERIDKMVEDFFEKRQKEENVMLKPAPDINPIPDVNDKVNGDMVKDSEVQPPNPVPPDSQSNEKKQVKDAKPVNEILPEAKESVDKVSESHPKNLKQKIVEAKLVNGASEPKKTEQKEEEKVEEKPKVNNAKPPSVQEKIDILKQQQLIETIKQHGEEQKELIREQKEILDELQKTKNELKQNKEKESNEAKKIAVESIQKIANMAIQSLSGVTDKPADAKEPLQKIADDAVQEIAKKAAETLDAIKEIDAPKETPKEKPVETAKVQTNNIVPNLAPLPNLVQNIASNVQKPVISNVPNIPNNKINEVPNIKEYPQINPQFNVIHNNDKPKNVVVQNVQMESKPHSHLPDEPQSYKQGEDVQDKANGFAQNVPLAIAMNGNTKLKSNDGETKIRNVETKQETNNANNINRNLNPQNGAAQLKDEIVVSRQKREVVDCTEKTSLKPEDKQICENLIDRPKEKIDHVLPNLNLGDVVLPKSLPMHNIAIHHIRSLKSYNEGDKGR